jgi:tetrahydromethanopterin S-methyltransferase subunit H
MCFGSTARADDRARAEMVEALTAQADLHPTPLALPSTAAAPRHAAAASAVQQGVASRGVTEAAGAAAHQASQGAQAQAQAQAQALAHQTQAAAAAAAEQVQSQAAKDRATHPHSR